MYVPNDPAEYSKFIRKKAEDKFGHFFHWVLKNERLFGRLLLEFDEIVFDENRCPIMSTDGDNLYINPLWLIEASRDDVTFITFHEILHCALEHFKFTKWAREYAEKMGINSDLVHHLLNISTDEEINHMLFAAGYKTELDVVCNDVLVEPVWQDVFKDLLEIIKDQMREEMNEAQAADPGENDGEGDSEESQVDTQDESANDNNSPDQNNQGEGGDSEPESEGDGDPESQGESSHKQPDSGDFDPDANGQSSQESEPLEGDSEGETTGSSAINDAPEVIQNLWEKSQRTGEYETEYEPDSERELDQTEPEADMRKTKWENALIDAVEISQGQTNVGGKLARMINEKMDQESFDWKSIFEDFLLNTYPNDFTMAWPDESFIEDDIYVATLEGEELQDLILVADCSGSINQEIFSDMIEKFNSACMSVKKISGRMIFWDAACKKDIEFNESFLPLNKDKLIADVPIGYSTEFNGLFKYVNSKGYNVACMVVLTDRYFMDINERRDYPVLWLDYGTREDYKGSVHPDPVIKVD